MPRPAPRSGIVLLLVSGMLLLLLLLGISILSIARIVAQTGGAIRKAAQARLAAASGCEYAAARLRQEPLPLYSTTPANRQDDWTFRDGPQVPLEQSGNPSYSHGEPWSDNAADGRYDPLTDSFTSSLHDRDGDGRFSAYSGRLRGPDRSGLRFSLKIDCPEGGIPLNAGHLSAPNYNSVTDSYHMGLIHALNNLGAIFLPASHPRRDSPFGNGPLSHKFEISWLGRDLIDKRPLGGYKNWAEIETILAPIGYTKAHLALVSPYIDLGPYASLGPSGRGKTAAGVAQPPLYAPVNLRVAPRDVLRSLWMYLSGTYPNAPE